jgi:rhodanese-related sulfurtransferase
VFLKRQKVPRVIGELADNYTWRDFNIGININFYDADFREQVAKLDRNIPVYVYCRSGGRSQKAMEVLKELGFSVVYELQGGYMNY